MQNSEPRCSIDGMNDAVRALANEKRRELLILLGTNPRLSVTKLATCLGTEKAEISQRLALLKRFGLVAYQREGKERMYSLTSLVHVWQEKEMLGIQLETVDGLRIQVELPTSTTRNLVLPYLTQLNDAAQPVIEIPTSNKPSILPRKHEVHE